MRASSPDALAYTMRESTVLNVAPMRSRRTSSGNRVEEKAKPRRKVMAARMEPANAMPAAASPD